MFESDEFDQILSQLDLPEPCLTTVNVSPEVTLHDCSEYQTYSLNKCLQKGTKENIAQNTVVKSCNITVPHIAEENNLKSPKHYKRKLINSYFDHKRKRKFPGPAGLLNGTLEDSKEVDEICHMELLSQDIDYSETYLQKGIFNSPIWERLLCDTKVMSKVDSIKDIKQQALKGTLRHQKAETITAYVERVDRSVKDPLIVLRDISDDIKCTLHRDAWIAFSPYIVSECCALVLSNPTVLTTGSAFKKHYLNITLSNIQAVYSTAIMKHDTESFPAGFIKIYDEDYTIIRNEKQIIGSNSLRTEIEDSNILDGLDGAFSDIFS